MKRWAPANLALSCMAAAALAAAPAVAQAPAAKPDGPRSVTLTGEGSLTGLWFGSKFSPFREGPPDTLPRERPTDDGKPPQVRPWAQKVVEDRIKQFQDGRPFAKLVSICIPDGVPSMMFPAPERPIEILESPGQVTILFEDLDSLRVIHLNGKHPKTVTPSLMGHSIGHWEGDTLVVDTIGLSDKTSVDNIIPHTDALHVTERFRRIDENNMDYRATIDDPQTFFKPYTVVFPFKKVAGELLQESACENQRNGIDENGNTGVQLKAER